VEDVTSAYDHLQLARSLFDLKEYVKAASVLLEYARPEHPSAYFFYYYSLYIVRTRPVFRVPQRGRVSGGEIGSGKQTIVNDRSRTKAD
jgi:hypothetical protein